MLSTHIMQEVEAVADRVIIIDHGEIKADDSKEDIYSRLGEQLTTIMVEFDKDILEKDLVEINGAGKIKMLDQKKWLIQASGSEDIRPPIFKFAVANSLTVLSMQQQEKSLEEVFRLLTS